MATLQLGMHFSFGTSQGTAFHSCTNNSKQAHTAFGITIRRVDRASLGTTLGIIQELLALFVRFKVGNFCL